MFNGRISTGFRITLILLCLVPSSSFAQYAVQPDQGIGQIKASVGCDKIAEGLKVTLLDEVSRAHMRDNFGIDVQLGDPCLASFAKFPPGFLPFATYFNPASGGASTQIGECLVWAIDDGTVSQVTLPGFGTFLARPRKTLACDATDSGELITAFVAGDDHTPEPDENCGVTRDALSQDGAQVRGPPAARFKYNGGTLGIGMLFVGRGSEKLEVLECNVNADGDDLIVKYQENQDGVDTSLAGESCMDVGTARKPGGAFWCTHSHSRRAHRRSRLPDLGH